MGPYATGALNRFPHMYTDTMFRPGPESDPGMNKWNSLLYRDKSMYHFCFPSIEAARQWFGIDGPDAIEALAEAGYKITEWDVYSGNVIMSDRQGVFLRSEADLVAEHPLEEMETA